MFRDDRQTAQACMALVNRLPALRGTWAEDGPTAEAVSLMEQNGGPLSSGERVLLLVAFAFWNGRGGLTFADVIGTLDGSHLQAVATLMVAASSGPSAIDAWVQAHSPNVTR